MSSLWKVFAFFIFGITACSSAPKKTMSSIVSANSAPAIFPAGWNTHYQMTSSPLAPAATDRCIKIISNALLKYPNELITKNLKSVYVLSSLGFRGVLASGTNSDDTVYVVCGTPDQGYSDEYVEQTFHHEFSSILLRNYPYFFSTIKWQSINPKSFSYLDSGVSAILANKGSQNYEVKLNSDGFLCDYSTSTLENDFNMIAESLFEPTPQFWLAVDKNQKIRDKVNLVIHFYNQLSSQFNEGYFRNFQTKH